MKELLNIQNINTDIINEDDILDILPEIINLKEKVDKVDKELRDKLKDFMEEEDTIKVETDTITVNYIEGSDREYFDKKKFKSENPKLYDEYVSFKPSKSSIRIKVNKEK